MLEHGYQEFPEVVTPWGTTLALQPPDMGCVSDSVRRVVKLEFACLSVSRDMVFTGMALMASELSPLDERDLWSMQADLLKDYGVELRAAVEQCRRSGEYEQAGLDEFICSADLIFKELFRFGSIISEATEGLLELVPQDEINTWWSAKLEVERIQTLRDRSRVRIERIQRRRPRERIQRRRPR